MGFTLPYSSFTLALLEQCSRGVWAAEHRACSPCCRDAVGQEDEILHRLRENKHQGLKHATAQKLMENDPKRLGEVFPKVNSRAADKPV